MVAVIVQEDLAEDIHLGGFSGGGRSSGGHSSGFGGGGPFDRPIPIGGYGYVPYSHGGIVEVIIELIGIIFLIIAIMMVSSITFTGTSKRVALSGVVNKTQWYEDNIGIITKKSQLKKGLKTFYKETGVQPYILFVTYSSNYWKGTVFNQTTGENYLKNYYNDKFTDTGHLIFAYFASESDGGKENLNGKFILYIGTAAKTVIDDEAEETLLSYFNLNYADKSLNIEKVISETFSETAKAIMPQSLKSSDIVKFFILFIEIVIIIFVVLTVIKRTERNRNIKKTDILDNTKRNEIKNESKNQN